MFLCCILSDLIGSQFEKSQILLSSSEDGVTNKGSSVSAWPSLRSESEKNQDREDGVIKSMEKLGKSQPLPFHRDDSESSSAVSDGERNEFLYSSLHLFSLLAPTMKSATDMADSSPAWSLEWFSVLCEIISTGSSSALRHLAKSMLQRLCGGRQEVYHRVRDHYVFQFQFRKLLQTSRDILDAALVVREQARQCG